MKSVVPVGEHYNLTTHPIINHNIYVSFESVCLLGYLTGLPLYGGTLIKTTESHHFNKSL